MAYTALTGSPFKANTSDYTLMSVAAEPASATQVNIRASYALGPATSLGTSGDRYRDLEVWIFNESNQQIGYGKVRVKNTDQSWAQNGEYGPFYLAISIPYKSDGTIKITTKTTGGTTTNSCLWTESGKFPNQVSFSWPVFNTAPQFPSGVSISLGGLSGIIPENTATINLSWPAATDPQGNPVYYDVWRHSSLGSVMIGDNVSGTSLADDIGTDNQGATYYLVQPHDGTLAGASIQSATLTKNTLSPAALNSSGTAAYGSTSIALSRTNASNSDGSAGFDYVLSCEGLTVYNPTVTSLGASIPVTIWRSGGYPSGPYIKFDELKTKLAPGYNGTLRFWLTTTNLRGTTAADYEDVWADIRTVPAGLGSVAYSGGYTHKTILYYLPDQRAVTVSWAVAADPLGSAIAYDVLYRPAGGAWVTAHSGITATSAAISPPSGAAHLDYEVKVIARSAYGYTAEAAGATLPVDRYLRPIIKIMDRDRQSTAVVVDVVLEMRTTVPGVDFASLHYDGLAGEVAVFTTATTDGTWLVTCDGLTDDSTFTLDLLLADSMDTPLGAARVTASIQVPSYRPMFAATEQGVGVNCLNDATDAHILRVRGSANSIPDPDGNVGWYVNGVNVLLMAHPVGSVYMSIDSTSPATLFGGTWAQLYNRFLIAAGDLYAVEATGGDASHTLTDNEMPYHTHPMTLPTQVTGGTPNNPGSKLNGGTNAPNTYYTNGGTGYTSFDGSLNAGGAGGGLPHNNMPPYLAVYMWKRTA